MFLFLMFVILMFCSLMLLKIKIDLFLIYQYQDFSITIQVIFFKIRIYNKQLSFNSQNKKMYLKNELFMEYLKSNRSMRKLVSKCFSFLKHVKIHLFTWESKIGVGKPDQTGFIVGYVWILKGFFHHFIAEKVKNKASYIAITPYFTQGKLHTQLHCIGSMQMGKAIYAFLKLRQIFMKEED